MTTYELKESRVNSEISLLDILSFLKGSWKVIALSGLVGIALSITYLALTPKEYEAIAKITMAQIAVANKDNSPLGVNVEEPALLITRLSSPTSLTSKEIEICGYENQSDAAFLLSKSIKLAIPKGVPNVLEMKTFGNSPKEARDCAGAIFELIKSTQNQMVIPYIDEAKQKLDEEKIRLNAAQEFVLKIEKSGVLEVKTFGNSTQETKSTISAAYLSTRSEINYLLDKIAALNNVVANNQNRATHLIAPIYASDMPISPKKRMVLAAGLLGGLFLGLLVAQGKRIIYKLKIDTRE